MQDELSQWLFGDKAILVTAPIADFRDSLYPQELEIISNAIEKRSFEFSTGRHCAHQALHTFGIDDYPILRGKLREPVWPKNFVGSISHCRDIAGAAIANTSQARSIGLDIENRKQINPDIARHVCTEREKNWLWTLATPQRNDALLQIFSIKEAVFKCIYQVSGKQLGFKQCQVNRFEPSKNIGINISYPEDAINPEDLYARIYTSNTHVYSAIILNVS